ncbi:hypothetical protein BH11CYA1_BH11CYA1_45890 [soil metagenome]
MRPSQINLRVLLCTACYFLAALAAVQLAPALAVQTALRFDQTHSFMGRSQMTVGAHGIRIENTDKLKFILVAKAPDWKVTVFRNDDKTYFTESLKEFQETGLFSGFILLSPGMHLEKKGFAKSVFKFCGHDVIRMTGSKTTLKYIPLGNVAPVVESIIYCAYKTPTNGGLPLTFVKARKGRDYFSGASQEGQREIVLDTSKIETVLDSPKFYETPKGYKLSKSLGAVFAGNAVRSDSVYFQSIFDMNSRGRSK